jgi:Zn-dependent protease with chaperone function
MAQIDFDLARYIAQRKGQVLQRARDGAAYGFSRELRSRRNLVALRPAAFAIDATSRHWKGSDRDELTARATRASAASHERVYAQARKAARLLALQHCPPIYVGPTDSPRGAFALGTEDEAVIIVHPSWVDSLSDDELLFLLGRTLGYVQNNLVPYSTTLYYLEHDAFFFVRWIVAPALMALRAWSRRADISCDRAGLVCCRDTGRAIASILRTSGGYSGPLDIEALAGADATPSAPVMEIYQADKHLHRRVRALRVFADTYLYSQLIGSETPDGIATDRADDMVADILEQ